MDPVSDKSSFHSILVSTSPKILIFFKGKLKSGTCDTGPFVVAVITSMVTSLMITSATVVTSVVKSVLKLYGSAGVVVLVVVVETSSETTKVSEIVA